MESGQNSKKKKKYTKRPQEEGRHAVSKITCSALGKNKTKDSRICNIAAKRKRMKTIEASKRCNTAAERERERERERENLM